MKNTFAAICIICFGSGFVFNSCDSKDSRYYGDAEVPGTAIFSNTGNNVMSCLIDGRQWRTAIRTYGTSNYYEIHLDTLTGTAGMDTLIISWDGYFPTEGPDKTSVVELHLAVPAGFNYAAFSALKGQRININGTNGYFTYRNFRNASTVVTGEGYIYFHTALLESPSQSVTGYCSGLFEAKFSTFEIESGRFDHILFGNRMVNF